VSTAIEVAAELEWIVGNSAGGERFANYFVA
jgi:hypothetical protein